jgi:hypothetical protein
MPSPLFQLAARAARTAAVRGFEQSDMGKLMRAVKAGGARRNRAIATAAKRYGRHQNPAVLIRDAMGTPLRDIVAEVRRYSKKSATRAAIDAVLKLMGPEGELIRTLTGSGSKSDLQAQLEAAARLLQAHGHVVISPKGTDPLGDYATGAEGLIEYLESIGHQVDQPGTPEKIGQPDRPRGGRQDDAAFPFGAKPDKSGQVEIPMEGLPPGKHISEGLPGGKIKLPANHPAVTGDEVRVKSSNVYSVMYDAERAILYVRFLDTEGRGTGKKVQRPGSLYRYLHVTPREFADLYGERNGSPGGWVWQHLRIRGTVSGHQKPYSLVGVVRGYVPRQATYVGGGREMWMKRRLHAGGGRWLLSEREDQLVPDWAYRQGAPDTGAPNAGKPNTGAP